jgi:hypothetical protein
MPASNQNDLTKRNIIQTELITTGPVPVVFATVESISKGPGISILGGIEVITNLKLTGRKI